MVKRSSYKRRRSSRKADSGGYNRELSAPRISFYCITQDTGTALAGTSAQSLNYNVLFGDLANNRNFLVTGYEVQFAPMPSLTSPVTVNLSIPSLSTGTSFNASQSRTVWLSPTLPTTIAVRCMRGQDIYTNGSNTNPGLIFNFKNPTTTAVAVNFLVKAWCKVLPDAI